MIKRLFLTLLFLPVAFLLLDPAETLLSRMLRLEQPVAHEIKRGEYLSKLAKEYYGDASYWRELALVNRAPNADYVLPGEEILVPSFESIQRIRRARTLSQVNRAVMEVQARLQRVPPPATQPEPTAAEGAASGAEVAVPAQPKTGTPEQPTQEEQRSSVEPMADAGSSGHGRWVIFGPVLGILVVGGMVIWRRRRRSGFGDEAGFVSAAKRDRERNFALEPLSDRVSEADFADSEATSEDKAEVLS